MSIHPLPTEDPAVRPAGDDVGAPRRAVAPLGRPRRSRRVLIRRPWVRMVDAPAAADRSGARAVVVHARLRRAA
jgi:hypothetical protein